MQPHKERAAELCHQLGFVDELLCGDWVVSHFHSLERNWHGMALGQREVTLVQDRLGCAEIKYMRSFVLPTPKGFFPRVCTGTP